MSITRTLAATLAIAALGVSGAQAQPADMHASTAIAAAEAQKHQDLRSADARDATVNARTPDAPAHAHVVSSPVKAVPVTTESGVDWLAIAIGAGLGVTAMTALVAVNSRRVRRLQRPRVTA